MHLPIRKRLAGLLVLVLLAGTASGQEIRYITDNLQLGLFATRDASGDPLRNLVSGTELTVLERIPNFARVRTPDGDEGWVKSAFLVSDKPARLRMAEAEARIEQLQSELGLAIAARDAATADAAGRVERAEREMATIEAERDARARLEQQTAAALAQLDAYRGSLPWPWVAGAVLVALGAGFFAGYWWLDASIRRRHGGFRVY